MQSCPYVHDCASGGGPKICNGMCIGESTMKVRARKKITIMIMKEIEAEEKLTNE